ncbi:MAG: proton-conducting transporter membrane subunit, partial [Pseudomonadota bacterium]
ALMGVAAGEALGAPAVLVYMTIYVATTLGIFGGVLAMRRRDGMVEDVSDLNGLIRHRPGVAVGMTLLVFSVAGIPPLAGFFGKWMVFKAALDADLLWLVIVGVVASVVSLGYYLRIVWAMMVEPAEEKLEPADGAVALTIYGATALAFPVFVVWIGALMTLAETAAAG